MQTITEKLQKANEEIQKMNEVEGWIALEDGFYYRKVGTDVEIYISMSSREFASGFDLVGVVDAKYMPARQLVMPIFAYSDSDYTTPKTMQLNIQPTTNSYYLQKISSTAETVYRLRGFIKYSTL